MCNFAISMATKIGRMVTCGVPTNPSNSCDLLIIWSRDKLYLHFRNTYGHQTWQSGKTLFTVGRPHKPSHVNCWSRSLVTNFRPYICRNICGHQTWQSGGVFQLEVGRPHLLSYMKLYLHFCSAYDHRAGQSGNLRWGEHSLKVTWPFNHAVARKIKKALSALPQYLTSKIGRVVTYSWKNSPTKSCGLWITWPHCHWKKETYICPYAYLSPPNLAEW